MRVARTIHIGGPSPRIEVHRTAIPPKVNFHVPIENVFYIDISHYNCQEKNDRAWKCIILASSCGASTGAQSEFHWLVVCTADSISFGVSLPDFRRDSELRGP